MNANFRSASIDSLAGLYFVMICMVGYVSLKGYVLLGCAMLDLALLFRFVLAVSEISLTMAWLLGYVLF